MLTNLPQTSCPYQQKTPSLSLFTPLDLGLYVRSLLGFVAFLFRTRRTKPDRRAFAADCDDVEPKEASTAFWERMSAPDESNDVFGLERGWSVLALAVGERPRQLAALTDDGEMPCLLAPGLRTGRYGAGLRFSSSLGAVLDNSASRPQ